MRERLGQKPPEGGDFEEANLAAGRGLSLYHPVKRLNKPEKHIPCCSCQLTTDREGQGGEGKAVPRGSAFSLEIPAAPLRPSQERRWQGEDREDSRGRGQICCLGTG